jgi:uncharacterized protein with ParB-like and HNH nuclease domain
MSYQTALTVYEAIEAIHKKKYLLPSIQREFIWEPYQIERLFDSLMRDYPINSFLFWEVNEAKTKQFEFYEFLREYHEKNATHNPKADSLGEEKITAILDGQQRLTSLYIGLRGSFAYRLPRKKKEEDQSYPKRKLYLNLLQKSEEQDLEFEFDFLTDEESSKNDVKHHWFRVGQILDMKEAHWVNTYLIENNLLSDYGKEKAHFANESLSKLHTIIHIKPTISYYLEKSDHLDKVLNIFIRTNSAGTELSYSDLLLSIATAQWLDRDAREVVNEFVDEINDIGDGFAFKKDFVLKACLVLSDITDIAFKVDNFNKANMARINKMWDEITNSIRIAVNLVSGFGFSGATLSSTNAIIPIAYFLMKSQSRDSFVTALKYKNERLKMHRWLLTSLMKKVFSGQPDNILRQIRKIIRDSTNGFPFEEIRTFYRGTNKTIEFSNEDIENLLWSPYGKSITFSVLSFLYPTLDFRNRFHIDHIQPKSLFTSRKLKKRGVEPDEIETYINNYNYLPNLQFLEEIPNIEKKNAEFSEWFKRNYKPSERDEYIRKHYFPDVDYQLNNFIEFFNERKNKLEKKLKRILQDNNDA